jgi:hypothetical protein
MLHTAVELSRLCGVRTIRKETEEEKEDKKKE